MASVVSALMPLTQYWSRWVLSPFHPNSTPSPRIRLHLEASTGRKMRQSTNLKMIRRRLETLGSVPTHALVQQTPYGTDRLWRDDKRRLSVRRIVADGRHYEISSTSGL